MIGPVRRTLTLIVLSIRDMLVSAGPVALIAAGVLVAAYWWLDPQPPKTVTLATGPAGSAYAEFGQRYAQALAKSGITVQQSPTEGSLANLQALRAGTAGAAFVRGGSADPQADGDAGITSLGALFYEPIWVLYRTDAMAAPAPTATETAATRPPAAAASEP
ncbi:MAG: C4-dicarboxylate ABC transporter substrate-binding protein, partial [Ottowia sp.]|nr:C4-dicarboxylate ABC transporter substrate-binding protein [Ottowia sp.]